MNLPIEYEPIAGYLCAIKLDGFSIRLPLPGQFEHYDYDTQDLHADVDDIICVVRRRNPSASHYPQVKSVFILARPLN